MSKLKAIVISYGSASQEASKESWRQSCDARWVAGMWSLSFGPSLPDSSSTVLLQFVAGCAQGQCSALQVTMTAL